MTSSAPTRPPLDREQIVGAGQRIVRRGGTEALTMRAVADELGVTPMAAYHYVASKDQLLEAVAEAVVQGVEPTAPDLRWDEQLKYAGLALVEQLGRHPGIAGFLLDRPLSSANRRAIRRGVSTLLAAGFDEHEAELAYATYHIYVFGFLAMESRFRVQRRHPDRSVVADAPRREVVEFGLDTLIAGLRARQEERV